MRRRSAPGRSGLSDIDCLPAQFLMRASPSKGPIMNSNQVQELLLQSLEHERGGVKIYKAAVECARRPDLKSEWTRYLQQTEQHVVELTQVCEVFGLDPFTMTPGTMIVRATGTA